jgi:uncharacterized membrane protein
MSMADASKAKLDLGRVFGDTFGVIRRQAPLLVGLTFVLSFLPTVVSGSLNLTMTSMSDSSPTASLELMKDPLYWARFLISVAMSLALLASLLRIAISDLEGHSLPLSELARLAIKKILPIFVVALLYYLGALLGLLLLVVPGLILSIMWIAALPIAVTETSNPIRALGRSRALTRGNRWRIFGLGLLAGVITLIVEVIVLGAVGGFGAGRGGMLGIFAVGILSFGISLFYSVGLAALYVQLRELKGSGGESLAQVFA